MSSNCENIYHEKQVKELCAMHALNNLFQEGIFTKIELDSVCFSLAPDVWINPHKSVLGIGNYDINVIMAALNKHGFEAIWFDKRKKVSSLDLETIFGFILNVPTNCRLGFINFPIKIKHWIAVRKIKNDFYNLDSKLDNPKLIGQEGELIKYFQGELDSNEKELFVVVSHANSANYKSSGVRGESTLQSIDKESNEQGNGTS